MSMLTKIKAGWNVLKAGEVVSNPIAWKKGQITTGHLVAVLSSIVVCAKVFGYDLPLDETQQAALATLVLWVFSLFNQYATVASTDKFGLKPNESVDDTSERAKGEVTDQAGQPGRYPATPDTGKLQDGSTSYEDQRARDSSLG